MPTLLDSEPVATPANARQCADAVLMVRPAAFAWNPQTQPSNRFQRNDDAILVAAAARACDEFDALANALRDAGIDVHVFADRIDPVCPDAVFPNNWLSCHADGSVVLYPLLAPNRRLERRRDLVDRLESAAGFVVRRVVDLTHFERSAAYLEGTGSLVLDHVDRVAYACLSPRTHLAPLQAFCAELGYEPHVFAAADGDGVPVYHTNVVLSVGSAVAIVAAANVVAADRERLLARLSSRGRLVVTIDERQTASFAANALELRGRRGTVLALSGRAASSIAPETHARLAAHVDRIVAVPVPTIETLGGGSVRCMLAEIFLPRAEIP